MGPRMQVFGRHVHIGWLQLGAYLLIVVVALIGFQQLESTQRDLCDVSAQNSKAIEHIVEAVTDLHTELVNDEQATISPDLKEHLLEEIRLFHDSALRNLDTAACKEIP